jgi:hypothetical protein
MPAQKQRQQQYKPTTTRTEPAATVFETRQVATGAREPAVSYKLSCIFVDNRIGTVIVTLDKCCPVVMFRAIIRRTSLARPDPLIQDVGPSKHALLLHILHSSAPAYYACACMLRWFRFIHEPTLPTATRLECVRFLCIAAI